MKGVVQRQDRFVEFFLSRRSRSALRTVLQPSGGSRTTLVMMRESNWAADSQHPSLPDSMEPATLLMLVWTLHDASV
jgi:hypothetical protein